MKVLLVACICATMIKLSSGQDPLVLTKQGLVRGTRVFDGDYSEFLGIPYAQVDLDNPFGVPLPPRKFDDLFEAHDESPICPQYSRNSGSVEGSLNCLTVNVFVPSSANSKNKLPVMVWIYGGGFVGGSASQSQLGPQYLVRHDVILVTLNYRLGPYGFMCLDIPSVPGNTGLRDQQAALHWINENIEAFGGNTSSITIFGQSAGAGSVHYHILSSTSNGLFTQAILQSATVFTNGIIEKSNPSAPVDLANKLGFETMSIENALEFLMKNVSSTDIIQAVQDLNMDFKPCIEKSFDNVKGFIIESPQKTLESGEYNSVPLIVGHTYQEDYMKINQPEITLKDPFLTVLSPRFEFKRQLHLETAVKLVQDFYVGHKDLRVDDMGNIINFYSDYDYNVGSDKSIRYHLEKSNKPVYQYVFAYVANASKQADHGEDIKYIFKDQSSNPSAGDQLIIDRVTKLWTNFAKYGNPTPELSELLPFHWPAATNASRDYILIDSEITIDRKVFHDRMAFWELFFINYGDFYWLA